MVGDKRAINLSSPTSLDTLDQPYGAEPIRTLMDSTSKHNVSVKQQKAEEDFPNRYHKCKYDNEYDRVRSKIWTRFKFFLFSFLKWKTSRVIPVKNLKTQSKTGQNVSNSLKKFPLSTTTLNPQQKISDTLFPGDGRLLSLEIEDDNFQKFENIRTVNTANVQDGYMLKIFLNEKPTFGLFDTGCSCVIMSADTKDTLLRAVQEFPVSPQNRFVLNANRHPLPVRSKCYIDLQFTENGVFFHDVMVYIVENLAYNFIIGEPIIRWIAESVGYSEVIRPDGNGTQLVIGSSLEPQEQCIVPFFNKNPYMDVQYNRWLNIQNQNFYCRPKQKNVSTF